MRICAAVLFGLMSLSAASADQKKAQSCAQSLQGEPKVIYEASAAAVAAGGDVKDTLESKTRSLVMDGKVARSSARASAEAAGSCLKLMKS
jgi:hypothetical protein